MKRNLSFSLILVVVATFTSQAQITVTRAAMPQIGHQVVTGVDQTTSFDVGNAGANQTWDFSNAVVEYYDTAVYILPQQAPNYQLYPGADMAGFMNSAEGMAYGFYEDSGTDIGIIGSDVFATIMPGFDFSMHLIYQQPQWLFLPYHYGDNHNYNITGVGYSGLYINGVLSDSTKAVSHINGTVLVDAWGTMITPTGTFPVLRVKQTQEFIDSLFTWTDNQWVFDYADPGSNLSYSWSSDQYGHIGQIYVDDRANGLNFFVSQTVVNSSNIALADKQHSISPNPATDIINIQLPGTIDKVLIYDMSGQLQMSSTNQRRINISRLNKGMYIAKIHTQKGTITEKFIKK